MRDDSVRQTVAIWMRHGARTCQELCLSKVLCTLSKVAQHTKVTCWRQHGETITMHCTVHTGREDHHCMVLDTLQVLAPATTH